MKTQATAPAQALRTQPKPDYSNATFQFIVEESPPPRPHEPSEFVKLVRKHRRLLTILGAGVVLLTFVAREGVREHLKDLEEDISKAHDLARENSTDDTTQLKDASALLASYLIDKSTPISPRKYTTAITVLGDEVGRIARQFQLNKEVDHQLKRHSSELKRLDKEIANLYWEWREVNKNALYFFFPDHPDDKRNLDIKRALNVADGIDLYKEQVGQTSVEIVVESETEMAEVRHQYEIATWVSYFLYAMGWSLGLVGRLVGVTASGEE